MDIHTDAFSSLLGANVMKKRNQRKTWVPEWRGGGVMRDGFLMIKEVSLRVCVCVCVCW